MGLGNIDPVVASILIAVGVLVLLFLLLPFFAWLAARGGQKVHATLNETQAAYHSSDTEEPIKEEPPLE